MDKEEFRKDLDFEEKRKELLRFLALKENATMVLATSYNERVLARNVLVASKGLDLYFFTWKHSRKCMQLEKNPKVALCKDRVQIEGVAEILGNLLDESVKKYTDIMRDKFPEAIKLWERRPGMVIVRVRPTVVVTGGSVDEPIHLDFLDLNNQRAYSERWAYY
jgi:general stress protein 26